MISLHFAMCDCVPSTTLLFPRSRFRDQSSGLTRRSCICMSSNTAGRLQVTSSSNSGNSQFVSACIGSNEAEIGAPRFPNPAKKHKNSSQNNLLGELGFKGPGDEDAGAKEKSSSRNSDATAEGSSPSSSDFLEFREKSEERRVERLKDEELVRTEGSEAEGAVVRRGKQLMRRSNMLAKQVISAQSALSLGFVSQLWVDSVSWVVVVVEVRPNLLSGESERFLLEHVSQVGDVVLIPDESVMETELKMIGLETLVGYNVVIQGQRSIGKVRGYTFNINSGAVESLELDSFGISIIPSTLVSTYSLFVEDVLEVVPDTVVVHEAAASRIQRLTKGLWDARKMGNASDDEPEEDSGFERTTKLDYGRTRRRSLKFREKMRDTLDDLELPMDYL